MKTAGIALALLALGACKKEPAAAEEEEAPPAHVTCDAAKLATIADLVVLRGSIEAPPLAQSVVASTLPGRIIKLTVQEGDVVTAGQLIAVMEDPSLGASATESGYEVAAAQAELRAATAERARREKLVAEGIAPQKELDEARGREDAARANVAAAQARSKLARKQLSRAELHAAHAGTVLRVTKRVGELVDTADAVIVEIADLSVLELRTQVTGADLIGLVPHTAATITLDAMPGVTITGEVIAVAPAVDPSTSLGTVRIRLTLPGALVPAIGLAGAASVARAPREAVVIANSAVRRSIDGTDEVLVCTEDHAEVRAVELGAHEGVTVEVRTGVTAGDRVIIDHVLGLEDGVAIEEAAAK